jgi:hypothetical protein
MFVEQSLPKGLINQDTITELEEEYRQLTIHNKKSPSIIRNDMINYEYLLSLRNKEAAKPDVTKKILFVSNDYNLIRFDNTSKYNEKIVVHPTRLYGTLLRFTGRITQSEIASFIRFLKIDVNSDEKIPLETIYLINDHINFYESNPELQKPYIDALLIEDILNSGFVYESPEVQRTKLHLIFEKVAQLQRDEIAKVSADKDVEIIRLRAVEAKMNKFVTLSKRVFCVIIIFAMFTGIYYLIRWICPSLAQDPYLLATLAISSVIFSAVSIVFLVKKKDK